MLHLLSLSKTKFEASRLSFVVFFPCTTLFPAGDDGRSGNGLRGTIPTEIGLLTSLTYLNFGELLYSKVASTPLLLPVSIQFLFC
jgi:hypothetical protein